MLCISAERSRFHTSVHFSKQGAQITLSDTHLHNTQHTADRLQEQLRIIGLPLDKLSPCARAALHTLASVASQLQLAHPSQVCVLVVVFVCFSRPILLSANLEISQCELQTVLYLTNLSTHNLLFVTRRPLWCRLGRTSACKR